jgi:hypothetical protein
MVEIDNFDDGVDSSWSINNGTFASTSSPTYSGKSVDQSVNVGNGHAEAAQKDVSLGQPDYLTFYFRERSGSNNNVFAIWNSNGNYEIGAGTDNPQWTYWTGGAGSQTKPGTDGNYDEWVKVKLDFDWPNDNVTISWDQVTGTSISESVTTSIAGVNVETIGVGPKVSGKSAEVYWDDFTYKPNVSTPSQPQNLTVTR